MERPQTYRFIGTTWGDETYCLERIHHYDLNRPEDIQKFQLHTKNIVDWGVSSRLTKIRAALDVILDGRDEKETAAEKAARRAFVTANPLAPSKSFLARRGSVVLISLRFTRIREEMD